MAGARVVAFDVLFRDRRDPEDDRALAESVRKAGNVLLIEDLVKERGTRPGGAPAAIEHRLQKVTLPFPELAAAALGTAPFPLPWVPDKLSQFWLFSPEEGEPWGDKACLPTLGVPCCIRRRSRIPMISARRTGSWRPAAADSCARRIT